MEVVHNCRTIVNSGFLTALDVYGLTFVPATHFLIQNIFSGFSGAVIMIQGSPSAPHLLFVPSSPPPFSPISLMEASFRTWARFNLTWIGILHVVAPYSWIHQIFSAQESIGVSDSSTSSQ